MRRGDLRLACFSFFLSLFLAFFHSYTLYPLSGWLTGWSRFLFVSCFSALVFFFFLSAGNSAKYVGRVLREFAP